MEKEFALTQKLLTLLDSEYRWFTLAEIEEQLSVSDKTIRKIIDETQQELPPSITIEISRGKGVILHYEKRNVAFGEVISSMYRQRTFYQLLDLLFLEGGRYGLEELADKLYMSSSSLKKLIIRLNSHELKQYHLRITYSMPEVKGSEINIRYFYWKLYYDAYEFSGWPFPGMDQAQMLEYITTVESENDIVYFLNAKRSLSFLAAIMMTRVLQGKYADIPRGQYHWESSLLHSSITSWVRTLEQRYSIHLPLDETRFLQAMLSLGQYNYYDEAKISTMIAMKKSKLMQIQEEEDQIVNHFLMLALAAFPAIDMNDRFIWEIGEFFEKLRLENSLPDMIAISTSSLTEYVQRECRPMYQSVMSCMQEWGKRYPGILYNDYHLTKLTLLIGSSLRYNSKKAFLLIGGEFSIRHYVAKLIKNEIGDELIINTSIMEGLTDEIIQKHNIDFVISTFPVELNTVPVVIISTIPTKRDLENIRKELMQP
ncbi:helix-turn-helix domain-containing protein [Paenibacillus solani]|uniref:Transcriptional antiterminator BglG n=1 Tax=Paenibacillus solani TaxID=1705565 RepID=A0A0M1N219_9BACL|nr:helix-turn-helix domain-containing protein [Paenibacillus solani]KOR76009.1 transcriptional antiterminator BglG [Paenibacillus solani]